MVALKEIANNLIEGKEREEEMPVDMQQLANDIINFNANIPKTSPNINQLLPAEQETVPDEFGGLSPEFQDKSPIKDALVNYAKSLVGVGEDTTLSLTKKPEEDLSFDEENVSALEVAFETVAPTLTMLSSPVTLSLNALLLPDDPKRRLQSMARIALLKPEEGDEIFVGDYLREIGITDENIDELLEPIIGPGGFAQTAELTDKIGLIGDFVGFSKFDKLLKGGFSTTKKTMQKEMLARIKEAKVAGKKANPGLLARIGKGVQREDGFAGFKDSDLLSRLKDISTEEIPSELVKQSKGELLRLSKEIGITPNSALSKDALIQKIRTVGFANPRGMDILRGGASIGAATASLALLGSGEAEAGVGDIAKKAFQFPGRAAKKTINTLDPLAKFPQKAINELANGFRIHDLVKSRVFDINDAFLESQKFITEFRTNLSLAEREALPFIRQGIKNSDVLKKIGREDLIPIIKNPSDSLLKFNEKLGKYYDDAHEMLSEVYDDVGFIKDYVTQIWDIPKNRRSEVVNYFATHNPFTGKRKIPTLEAGIGLGLKPKHLDIAKLLQSYDQYKIKTVFNNRFAEALKSMTDAETGISLIQRADKAPYDWVAVDHPALNRAMAIGQTEVKGVKVPILRQEKVKVHPDIADEVEAVFSVRLSPSGKIAKTALSSFETINAFAKKGMLSFSFFHHFALTESAFSSGIGLKAIKLWNPYKVYRALKHKEFEVFKNMPAAKDSIQHGVTYGPLSDFMITKVRQGIESVETATKKLPVIGRTTKLARQANDLWDSALWDYYHNTLKLYAYEKRVGIELKRASKKLKRELTAKEIKEIKDGIGSFVNDSFGGQNWELQPFFRHAQNRQMMHWALLSPDWTISVLKQAFAPIKGHRQAVAAGSIERRLAGKALSSSANRFWIKAIVYYNIVAQSANYYNTRKYEWIDGKEVATFNGTPRFTDINAPGHKLDIFAGFNDDGTEKYIRMGKQFREVMEWSYEPERKLGAKLAPITRQVIAQFSKHDPGSGYPTSYADLPFFKSLTPRAKEVMKSVLPFSFKGLIEDKSLQPFMFALPTSRGMTNFKTAQIFKEAIEAGDMARIIEVAMSALRNNLDADILYKRAVSELKGEGTKEAKEVAKWVYKTISKFPESDQPIVYKQYVNQGLITPAVQKRLKLMKKNRLRVKIQRKGVGLE